jgi:hypothetical protein
LDRSLRWGVISHDSNRIYFQAKQRNKDTIMIYNDILETIGNTPVIKIQRMGPDNIDMYVKAEAFNPMGSVKDRLAIGIILDAEKRGVCGETRCAETRPDSY